ncbi:MAG: gephyrin-like molybdotransferase Glp [Brotaphodocola sp.]
MSKISFYEARNLLLEHVGLMEKEWVSLEHSYGRILGENVTATENVPPFDRSPYDGYAFRSVDSALASKENPVTLKILEEIPAGGISHFEVTEMCAVKILTGALIPPSADAVVPFEKTEFTEETVTLSAPSQSGSNIVKAGEDIACGEILAQSGTKIEPELMGTLASQNIENVLVYRVPKIGIISTGSELLSVGSRLKPGKIYNANQYLLEAAVRQIGCEPVVLGIVGDRTAEICERIIKGLGICDMVLLTGGVSVGDYDLTPAAMEMAGVKMLYRGLDLKPGMACASGIKDGKLVCGLSGNPNSAMTDFYAVIAPVLKKLSGDRAFVPKKVRLKLLDDFKKTSYATRLLRGTLELENGTTGIRIAKKQGNVALSSSIGCNVMAMVPAGSGPQAAGTILDGFLIHEYTEPDADGETAVFDRKMKIDGIPVLGFAAYSGVGKTTLIEKLIPILREKGLRIAVIKHDGHDFDIDREGKDSWRFGKAGTDICIIVSPKKMTYMEKEARTFSQVLAMVHDVDLVLVEGYKNVPITQIGICRKAVGKGFTAELNRYAAVVTDMEEPEKEWVMQRDLDAADIPKFSFQDVDKIAAFIVENRGRFTNTNSRF